MSGSLSQDDTCMILNIELGRVECFEERQSLITYSQIIHCKTSMYHHYGSSLLSYLPIHTHLTTNKEATLSACSVLM